MFVDPFQVAENVGEWFELHNTTTRDLHLNGLVVFDDASSGQLFEVFDPIVLPAGGYVVFGRNTDFSINGGVNVAVAFDTYMTLENEADAISIGNDNGVLDTFRWSPDYWAPEGEVPFLEPTEGASFTLDPSAFSPTENDDAGNWCLGQVAFGRGDLGTPGSPNSCEPVEEEEEEEVDPLPKPANDINVGDLVITEVMQNPAAVADAVGEYFEIHNTTGAAIDIRGLVLRDQASDKFTIPFDEFDPKEPPIEVPANGYYVFGADDDTAVNGGVTVDYDYSRANMVLSNGPDELELANDNGVLDSISWDGTGTSWPDPEGASMNLEPTVLNEVDNDNGGNWCTSATVLSGGDLGTPGAANDSCP